MFMIVFNKNTNQTTTLEKYNLVQNKRELRILEARLHGFSPRLNFDLNEISYPCLLKISDSVGSLDLSLATKSEFKSELRKLKGKIGDFNKIAKVLSSEDLK